MLSDPGLDKLSRRTAGGLRDSQGHAPDFWKRQDKMSRSIAALVLCGRGNDAGSGGEKRGVAYSSVGRVLVGGSYIAVTNRIFVTNRLICP